MNYPRIKELGVEVRNEGSGDYVQWNELREKLGESANLFSHYFGIQTCFEAGPFADDVEAVLERMASGRKTGSQLFWD